MSRGGGGSGSRAAAVVGVARGLEKQVGRRALGGDGDELGLDSRRGAGVANGVEELEFVQLQGGGAGDVGGRDGGAGEGGGGGAGDVLRNLVNRLSRADVGAGSHEIDAGAEVREGRHFQILGDSTDGEDAVSGRLAGGHG